MLQPFSFRSQARTAVVACLAVASALGCQGTPRPPGIPLLSALPVEPDVKASGSKLMGIVDGLHRLDRDEPAYPDIVIAVHGYASRGYEWIYPLQEMGAKPTRIYFYRWNWDECPSDAATKLHRTVEALLARDPTIKRVRMFSHSYGGVITGLFAQAYEGERPIDVHIIASPLAGLSRLPSGCRVATVDPTKAPNRGVRWHEWRTQQSLDGAFKDLPTDPQVIELLGSSVTRLPDTYRGHRLGHNWSISWVTDTVLEEW